MENTDTKNTHQENVTPENTAQNTQSAENNTADTESQYQNLYLRTNADFQNFKRRTERERAEWTILIKSEVIEKMLPFADDLERAITTAEQQASEGSASWLEGFKLILKNFNKTLTDMGVEEIATVGDFNPELHEALMHVESSDHTSGQIVQVLSKGYVFKGKVVRHARVSVAK